ncbi:2-amino-4-hydroxy-6-hydroxymethyldihydropteridine diphosphokinase [Candidatus Kaiserbacteria bacterium RIFCSPLOWO2_12_FULL_53_8]|uniref:2-amino-4-hydroxy-6-hydroxymethyldihydropteridine diphosphokinase n=2 Tax=Candidatus Kaiseribacteriota TaxID=1752734 RepID=A0A1F6CUJ1_9BACT|nr:MAG: 2-amino-4-hydroxy-6-hydroxymethyldihydropteridine diphosphokinase [Candidatus Kaiserbacteria bacterium RIFCSPHIGHO2_01_FULL_53_29]OGG90834.1 MAG: 2-amino-4-hydroxy-6-hydroxymethyldihydropteridine diphosphokinase [Candidatus Kaiserbacteria bacterium RIFCSPLOWO2_12_FULL_53_8]
MNTTYLAFGSNLGDRDGSLQRAIVMLAPEITVTEVSQVYETEPMYLEEQPKFLNMVVEATTELSASEVFKKIKSIEKEIGRGDSLRNAPRVIDIDLLFYGNEVIETDELVVPHPKIAERPFVLVPLNDIAPDFVHPTLGVSIAELLKRLGNYHGVQLCSNSRE